MTVRSSRTEENVFVVRTWNERGPGGESQWRASVTHVLSGDRRYFTSYDDLHRFLDRWKK
ncbi:MAG TPA: hypothetical protein VMD07_09740 [Candidatus Acidoferrales bacterium]|nr:hypothetical protein [Candidatus Acidoferrales bacterium]